MYSVLVSQWVLLKNEMPETALASRERRKAKSYLEEKEGGNCEK